MPESALIPVAQAAEATGYSLRQIQHLLKNGTVRGEKKVRDWFVDLASLKEYQEKVRKGRRKKRDQL